MRLISRLALSVSGLLSLMARASNFLLRKWDSFVVVVLTPQEMLERGKRVYGDLALNFSNPRLIAEGLSSWERQALGLSCPDGGKLLVLAGGGGREAIAAAKMGFHVTSVDALAVMTEHGKKNAAKENLTVDFITGDLLDLPDLPDNFDCCLLSDTMYSAIPTPELRIRALAGMQRLLRADGTAIIHFLFDPARKKESLFRFRKFVARLCGGNTSYMPGDEFYSSLHFMRCFTNEAEIISEARGAGLTVAAIRNDGNDSRYALLKKDIAGS